MSHQANISDYSRYFSLRQKVYLVNMSSERNSEIYESLSGIVTFSGIDSLQIMITHAGDGVHDAEIGNATYKLTSEALGSGIQVLADLTGVVSGNLFQFRMHGALELFQRRVVTRVEFPAQMYHLVGNYSLAVFKREWKRVIDHQRTKGVPPGLVFQNMVINLSAGGIGFAVDKASRPTPLSLLLIALDEGLPVCALAENVWERGFGEKLRCGLRFIQILKADQERISNYISSMMQLKGGTHIDYKRNWVLLDKMVTDEGEKK